MAKIKKNDFVEIEYDAYDDQNNLFDTTNKEKAIKNQLYNKTAKYGPVIIDVGLGQVLKGLDEALVDKDAPCKFKISINPEEAFGKKNPKLLKLISKNVFTKNKINPIPGLQLNIDGMRGTVKTVSGGRIIVDFNHPLSGRNVTYDVKVNKIVTDLKEKINGLLELTLKTKAKTIDEKDKDVIVKLETKVNQDILNNLAKKLSEILHKNVSIVASAEIQ